MHKYDPNEHRLSGQYQEHGFPGTFSALFTPWFTLKPARRSMPNENDFEKPGFGVPERRKRARRADSDRRN